MLQWLCGKLPWEHNLKDPVAVQTAKTKLMDELPDSVVEWNSSGSSCSELSKFLVCVYGLAYDEKPKYQELKKILLDGLEMSGIPYDGPLEFSTAGCTQITVLLKRQKFAYQSLCQNQLNGSKKGWKVRKTSVKTRPALEEQADCCKMKKSRVT